MAKFNFLHTPGNNRETNFGRSPTRARARRSVALLSREIQDSTKHTEQHQEREDDVPTTRAWVLR